MQSDPKKQNDLRRLVQTVSRKKWLILICIIGALLPIIYFNTVSLPIYEATTMIVCEEPKGTIPALDITQTRLGNTFIMNQIQEIKSWSLANEVARALPDSVLNTFPLPAPVPANFNKEEFFTFVIQENISANTISNSDVIKINGQAHNAKSACIIANTVAELLKQRNVNARRGEIHNVRGTIEEQVQIFKQKVEETEQVLKDYKERNKVTFLDQESQEVFRRITEAEVEYNKVKTEHDAAKKRLNFVQNKLSQEREELVPSITTTTSPWAQRLKESLIELEVQYTTLKVQNYDDNHPQMKKLKSQIEETKKNLKEETLKIAKGESTIDPLSQIQKNLEEIAALEVEIHTYQAQEKALQKVLDSYNNSLETVPEKELELGRLMRDKAVADNIYTMLLQKREEAKITEAEKVGNIRIIDPARIPKAPIKPRKMLNLIIGFIVGCSIGLGLAFLLESFDNTIKAIDEVEKYINLTVLSSIPKIRNNDSVITKMNIKKSNNNEEILEIASKLITGREPKSPPAEAFRTLRTNIMFAGLDSSLKTILVTSTYPGEGKSLVAANLAIAIAQSGLKILLVDLDLRKPVMHSLFGTNREPGITNVMTLMNTTYLDMDPISEQNKNLMDSRNTRLISFEDQFPESDNSLPTIITAEKSNDESWLKSLDSNGKETIHPTSIQNLFFLSCGKIPPNPSEILGSRMMKYLIATFKDNYDVIVLDSPPVLAVTDAAILGSIADGVILVIRSGKNGQKDILRAKNLLERGKSNLIGAVLNDVDKKSGYDYYYYYSEADGKKKRLRRKGN